MNFYLLFDGKLRIHYMQQKIMLLKIWQFFGNPSVDPSLRINLGFYQIWSWFDWHEPSSNIDRNSLEHGWISKTISFKISSKIAIPLLASMNWNIKRRLKETRYNLVIQQFTTYFLWQKYKNTVKNGKTKEIDTFVILTYKM
jgi:hypothetical protein